MTRREVFLNVLRVALLRCLDRLSLRLAERAVDRPFDREASRQLDAALTRREDEA